MTCLSVHGSARLWWSYAIGCVLRQRRCARVGAHPADFSLVSSASSSPSGQFTSDYLAFDESIKRARVQHLGKQYRDLFLQALQRKTDAEKLRRLEELRRELPMQTLLSSHIQARRKFLDTARDSRREGSKTGLRNTLWSALWGRSRKSEDIVTDNVGGREAAALRGELFRRRSSLLRGGERHGRETGEVGKQETDEDEQEFVDALSEVSIKRTRQRRNNSDSEFGRTRLCFCSLCFSCSRRRLRMILPLPFPAHPCQ